MRISRTTQRMAERRGFQIAINDCDEQLDGLATAEFVKLDGDEPDDDYHALYVICPDGLHFRGGLFDREEWPNWIESDEKLRGLLDAMADEMA